LRCGKNVFTDGVFFSLSEGCSIQWVQRQRFYPVGNARRSRTINMNEELFVIGWQHNLYADRWIGFYREISLPGIETWNLIWQPVKFRELSHKRPKEMLSVWWSIASQNRGSHSLGDELGSWNYCL